MNKEQSHHWIVQKFGGTSVSQAAYWQVIAKQATLQLEQGHHVAIVVSALSGVTNQLTQICQLGHGAESTELLDSIKAQQKSLFEALGLSAGSAWLSAWDELQQLISGRPDSPDSATQASILACGEQLTVALGGQFLEQQGIKVASQPAGRLLRVNVTPEASPMSASCNSEFDSGLEEALAKESRVHLIPGFQAQGPDGAPWLLGRGGSDTSAACIAAILGAKELQIWTDVPGLFSADPRVVPHARLLKQASYSEAQELASMGAKVLHPPSVRVCREAGIPVRICDTTRPEIQGTRIGPRSSSQEAQVKGIVSRRNITLVMMENPAMWRQVGFLADAFELFRKHGLSIDLISTSESSVTVSLDPSRPGAGNDELLNALVRDLSGICTVQVRTSCESISLVGNSIRTILGRLSSALDVFQDRKVHMVTQSANDLNLTLVVDEAHGDKLVQTLHQQLISPETGPEMEFGDSWLNLTGQLLTSAPEYWWKEKPQELLSLMQGQDSAYVYDLESMRSAAQRLLGLDQVSRVLFAMKANDHPDVLRALHAEGVGFDCVSLEEVRHGLREIPGLEPSRILYTPNFATRDEFRQAFELGVQVTVDNAYPLEQWGELFSGKNIFLRVDLAFGHGHHRKVVTSGAKSKFGIGLAQLPDLVDSLTEQGIRVTGLHAHTGSGVHEPSVWGEQLRRLAEVMKLFPDVKVLDLGGGLGVPDHAAQPVLNVSHLNEFLTEATADMDVEIWLEPGRYLVAEGGVLLARVAQLKSKGEQEFLGLTTGMNSLIRPALYGAYHQIVNLSRLQDPEDHCYTVVGPICESGDVLGETRYLPESREGDVILIANTGAYGRVMASSYNRREPAQEIILT